MSPNTIRAVYLGGPLDGKVESDHTPDPSGYRMAYGVEQDATDRAFGRHAVVPVIDDPGYREWRYRAHRVLDTDGTVFLVYVPDERRDLGERNRPPLTLWEAVTSRYDSLIELELARRARFEAEAIARAQVQRADGLARRLRDKPLT